MKRNRKVTNKILAFAKIQCTKKAIFIVIKNPFQDETSLNHCMFETKYTASQNENENRKNINNNKKQNRP